MKLDGMFELTNVYSYNTGTSEIEWLDNIFADERKYVSPPPPPLHQLNHTFHAIS